MVDAFGTTGMIVLAVLALAAIYILMRLMGRPSGDEGEQEEAPASSAEKNPAMISDEEFIESYTGPMLEDALETLEEAVDSIKAGLEYYKRPAWEAAGEEFHSAVKGIDNASERLKEVTAIVEDPGSKPSKQAKARAEECRMLRSLTIRMEEACDARVDGKEEEAKKLETVMPELERLASSFKK
jgi:hypothetical protein